MDTQHLEPPTTPPAVEWVGTGPAARRLGVTPQTVRRWVTDGTLAGRRIGGRWKVHAPALAALLAAPASSDPAVDA